MNKNHRLHQVNITFFEFEKLIKKFPQQAPLLRSLTNFTGTKTIIDLNDLTPKIKEDLGNELMDYLFRLAYNLNEKKFLSYFYQLNVILNLPKSKVHDILEIGPGAGIFEALINNFDYKLVTLDIKPEYSSDIIGDVANLPIKYKAFDLICAFEVSQHLPHKYFQAIIKEMTRCSRHYLYISLPCPTNSLYFHFKLNFPQFFIQRFLSGFSFFHALPTKIQDIDGKKLLERSDKHNPHYWEVNRNSFPKKRILKEIENCNLKVIKEFHNPLHPYHYFILCEIE